MEGCSFHSHECYFDPVIEKVESPSSSEIFNVTEQKKRVKLHKKTKSLFDGYGRIKKGAKLFHSSSSSQLWFKTSLPFNSDKGGVFFSTDVELSELGGKAPFGTTMLYETIAESPFVIPYIKRRDELVEDQEFGVTGDMIATQLLPQFFLWGYYSCDECELFLTNEAINLLFDLTHVKLHEDRRSSGRWSVATTKLFLRNMSSIRDFYI